MTRLLILAAGLLVPPVVVYVYVLAGAKAARYA